MRLLLTRHAQTKHNINNLIQGKDSRFSSQGYAQIKKLINRLRLEKIDLIFSSDLIRCKETAEIISKELKIPLEYSKKLREKFDGDWIGKNIKEVNWNSLKGTFESRRAPNGESLEDVRERARAFIKELVDNYSNTEKTILIVSHSTIIRVMIGDILCLSLKDSIFKTQIENCSLTEVEFSNKYKLHYHLKYFNEKYFLY